MNKHINSFNNLLQYSSNYSTIENPSVTYLKDEDSVIFKAGYHAPTEDKTKAHVGDLVFLNDMIYTDDIEGDCPLYMDPRDPKVPYMFDNDVCLGIVVSLPGYNNDDKIRIVSLNYMDYNNPQEGSEMQVNMMWGKYGVTVTDLNSKNQILAYTPGTTTLALTNYSYFGTDFGLIDAHTRSEDVRLSYDAYAGSNSMVPSPYTSSGSKNSIYFSNSSSILNDGLCGSDNTDKIVAMSTAEVGDSSFDNQEEVYPAAMCCASYYKGTLEDWGIDSQFYLPSIAELGLMVARMEEVNFARTAIGYSMITNLWLWSSSLYSSNRAWRLDLYLGNDFGDCGGNYKYGTDCVLAFKAL